MQMFKPITDFFTTIFNMFHSLILNMGIEESGLSYVLAIILLTVLIRACLLPFNIKSAHSNRRMQEIQPEVKKLQAKYKNDPQKMNTEVMSLYKEKNVSMMGGCLPSILPMPILMALYYVFYNMPQIDGQSFLWITNLGAPDPYYILPVLSAIMTYIPSALMTKATPTPSTQEGAPTMNMNGMNIGMSLIMGYFALKFKSILVIYWIVGGVIQLATTYFINYKPAMAKRAEKEQDSSFEEFAKSGNEKSKKVSKKKKK